MRSGFNEVGCKGRSVYLDIAPTTHARIMCQYSSRLASITGRQQLSELLAIDADSLWGAKCRSEKRHSASARAQILGVAHLHRWQPLKTSQLAKTSLKYRVIERFDNKATFEIAYSLLGGCVSAWPQQDHCNVQVDQEKVDEKSRP